MGQHCHVFDDLILGAMGKMGGLCSGKSTNLHHLPNAYAFCNSNVVPNLHSINERATANVDH